MMKPKECGRLLQVKSGEGKSCILAMAAATLALMGRQVDVVTSSPVLAKRDCDMYRNFYSKLGLTVACNEQQLEVATGMLYLVIQVILSMELPAALPEISCAQNFLWTTCAVRGVLTLCLLMKWMQCSLTAQFSAHISAKMKLSQALDTWNHCYP
jgi:hypothetical protein